MAGTTDKETLQCVACAARLDSGVGDKLDYNSFVSVLKKDRKVIPNVDNIWKNVGSTEKVANNLEQWAKMNKNSSQQKEFDEWVDSSIWVANSLHEDKHFSGDYKFYHADAFQPNFKNVFNVLKKKLKKAAQGNQKFAKGTAGQIYNNLKLDANKWNPADMIAVKKGMSEQWATHVGSFAGNTPILPPGIKGQQLKDDLHTFLKEQTGESKKKVQIIENLEELYDYNKLIQYGIDSGEFIPISLKMTKSPNPAVGITQQSEPKDLAKYFKMRIKIDKVKMLPTTQKSELYFRLTGLAGKQGRYYFDARGFEPTEKLEDIQIQLVKVGADAAAGKLTLPVTTIIAKLSKGTAALSAMNRKKANIFRDPKWGLPRSLQTKLKSGIHGFIDYRIFDVVASGKEKLNTENVVRFGEYVQWLTKGKISQKVFMDQALKDTNYNKAMERGRKQGKVYDITLASTQAKYMKNKLQAAELTYVLTESSLSKEIKQNILRSMWLYAASEGLHIFNRKTISTYMMISSYLKCAK
tara:strand:+ start:73 stop:1644 length:1572 start_codon:yes stop_codon:yes gene_type:complete